MKMATRLPTLKQRICYAVFMTVGAAFIILTYGYVIAGA